MPAMPARQRCDTEQRVCNLEPDGQPPIQLGLSLNFDDGSQIFTLGLNGFFLTVYNQTNTSTWLSFGVPENGFCFVGGGNGKKMGGGWKMKLSFL